MYKNCATGPTRSNIRLCYFQNIATYYINYSLHWIWCSEVWPSELLLLLYSFSFCEIRYDATLFMPVHISILYCNQYWCCSHVPKLILLLSLKDYKGFWKKYKLQLNDSIATRFILVSNRPTELLMTWFLWRRMAVKWAIGSYPTSAIHMWFNTWGCLFMSCGTHSF